MSKIVQIDTDKLEALIEQKDFVAAKKMLVDYIDQGVSKEEQGKTYVHLAKIYLHVSNKITENYIKELDETIELAKKVTASQKASDKEIKTAEIRQKLAEDSN